MWELDHKKVECWRRRTDAFELRCWRKLMRVPWTARRSKQSILMKINSEYSLEGLMLKVKLQYFGHLMRRTGLIGKGTDAGKVWRLGHMGMPVDEIVYCIISSINKSLSNLQDILVTGTPSVFQSMGLQLVGHNWETEQ